MTTNISTISTIIPGSTSSISNTATGTNFELIKFYYAEGKQVNESEKY